MEGVWGRVAVLMRGVMGWERRRGLGLGWVAWVGVRWGGWGGDCRPQGWGLETPGEIVEAFPMVVPFLALQGWGLQTPPYWCLSCSRRV